MKKVIIVGMGNIGYFYDYNLNKRNIFTHFRAFKKSNYFDIVGCVEKNLKKKKFLKKKIKNIHSNIDTLDDDLNPDLVVVACSTRSHLKMIYKLINKFKPKVILCEKPIDFNYIEIKKLHKFCKKKKINIFVNYLRRSNPLMKKIKLEINKIKTTKVFGTYTKNIIHNGFHHLDTLSYLFGKIIKIEKIDNLKKKKYPSNIKIVFKKVNCYISEVSQKLDIHNLYFFGKTGILNYLNSGQKVILEKKIQYKLNYFNKFDKKKINSLFKANQYHVVNELEKFFKKKKYSLSTISDEINYHIKLNESK